MTEQEKFDIAQERHDNKDESDYIPTPDETDFADDDFDYGYDVYNDDY